MRKTKGSLKKLLPLVQNNYKNESLNDSCTFTALTQRIVITLGGYFL